MDIFHFFIVIPQLTAASVPDELLKRCFHGQPVWALAVADVSLFVAGLCTLRVRLAEWLSAYSGCLMLFPQQSPRATAAINPLIKHHDPRGTEIVAPNRIRAAGKSAGGITALRRSHEPRVGSERVTV
jgi:hypothetical protein